MDKQTVIENLYQAFSQYTSANMHYCDCGCIDDNDVRRLASKPLRELEEEDFTTYHGDAIYTWGDLEHYKHYLPRMLEVYNGKKWWASTGLFEFGMKFEHIKWKSWDKKEVRAIKDFILMDWVEFVHDTQSRIDTNALKQYLFFFDLEDLFEIQKLDLKQKGLQNFVEMFYYLGDGLLDLSDNNQDTLRKYAEREELVEKLEDAFFQGTAQESEYTSMVSFVLQRIESIIKNGTQ